MSVEENAWIVRAMCEPSFYDHSVADVQLIETHISWVFLAGDFAYKVKKALNLGFLDFSTLENRRHYCHAELMLNRRFVNDIYLDVINIGGTIASPRINAVPTLEYAVKMRRFPQEAQLDRMLVANRLQHQHIVAFAELLAKLHQQADIAEPETSFGSPDAAMVPVAENFRQIRPLVAGTDREGQLDRLELWAHKAHAGLSDVIAGRKTSGYVRACHGDVHLANMAWFNQAPLLFDCIEFNDNLRLIDVMNDIAFLVMDLDDRGQSVLGWTFLNRYLQETGDYQGLPLLNFYKVYRALVRAKVTGLRLSQKHFDSTKEHKEVETLFHSYLNLAEDYTYARRAPLLITHGFSGSGKSTFATQLANHYGAIHLRSDIERKRLHGLHATDQSDSPIDGGIYSFEAFVATYGRLRDLAEMILPAGVPVIVDATFLKMQQRELFIRLADRLQVPLVILDFPRPGDELQHRIEQRLQEMGGDASEANQQVLTWQQKHAESLTSAEEQYVVTVAIDTQVDTVIAALPKSPDPDTKVC